MLRSIYAGLQQTSVSYEEASQNVGATPLRTLYKITLPLVIANILAGAILVFSFSMLEVSDSLILAMQDKYYPITKAIWALSQRPDHGAYTASALGVVGNVNSNRVSTRRGACTWWKVRGNFPYLVVI